MNLVVPKANHPTIRIKLDGKWMGNLTYGKRILSLIAVCSKIPQGCMTIWESFCHSVIQLPTKTRVSKGKFFVGFWNVGPAIVEELVHFWRDAMKQGERGILSR